MIELGFFPVGWGPSVTHKKLSLSFNIYWQKLGLRNLLRNSSNIFSWINLVNSFIAFQIKALFRQIVCHCGTIYPGFLTFSETPYTLCAWWDPSSSWSSENTVGRWPTASHLLELEIWIHISNVMKDSFHPRGKQNNHFRVNTRPAIVLRFVHKKCEHSDYYMHYDIEFEMWKES